MPTPTVPSFAQRLARQRAFALQRKKRKPSPKIGRRRQQWQDNMALGRVGALLVLVAVVVPLLLGFILWHVSLPFDVRIAALPPIVTHEAVSGGLVAVHHQLTGARLKTGEAIVGVMRSNLPKPSAAQAEQWARLQTQISRLETQSLGVLTWELPEHLRARALKDADFAEFVFAQQKEFDDYYDSLDQYGREIYRQKQRLADRIADARAAIADDRQEKQRISARLVEASEAEKPLLRREIAYLNDDIAQTETLLEQFTAERRALEPRLQRLIRRKSVEVVPQLEKLRQKQVRVVHRLGLDDPPVVTMLTAARAGQLAEVTFHNVGDVFVRGEVLYRLLPSADVRQSVRIAAAVPRELHDAVAVGSRVPVAFVNADTDWQTFEALSVGKTVNLDAGHDAAGYMLMFEIPVAVVYRRLQRVPALTERGRLAVPLPPPVRLAGYWRRVRTQRRELDPRALPTLNRRQWQGFRQEFDWHKLIDISHHLHTSLLRKARVRQ